MRAGIIVFAVAMASAAAQADVTCGIADADGNMHHSILGAEPGGRQLDCADEAAVEPPPGYAQDPGKVLRADTERSAGYKCVLENELRRKTCIDGAAVRMNVDLRASELLVGRPERVRATGIDLVVDCRTARSALRSRDGTPFTGELPVSADASKGRTVPAHRPLREPVHPTNPHAGAALSTFGFNGAG